jgi:hypothetical protein
MAAKNDIAALTKAAADAYEAYAQAQAKLDDALAGASLSDEAVGDAPAGSEEQPLAE